jgi:hypothetical protein
MLLSARGAASEIGDDVDVSKMAGVPLDQVQQNPPYTARI